MATQIKFTTTYDTLPRTHAGITYTSPSSGVFRAVGTSTGISFLRLYYNQRALPSWFNFDTTYNIHFNKTGNTTNIYLEIYCFTSSGTSVRILGTQTETSFKIASSTNYVGMLIRLGIPSGNTVDGTIEPYLIETIPFVPRTSKTSPTNMVGNPYYAGQLAGYYALPNCTRYAYGRWWEIMGQQPTGLANKGNAEDWWNGVTAYQKGQQPALGAIICFADGIFSGWGHVAVVEKIYDNGDLLISNSGYPKRYFYMTCVNASDNYRKGRRGYEGYAVAKYRFLGFIYLPEEYAPSPTPPPDPTPTQGKKPLWFYTKRKPF